MRKKTALGAICAAILIAVTASALPDAAWAHAQLVGSSPARGETLPASPRLIELEFNEPVEAAFGALRLFDSDGRQVETESPERPGGRPEAIAVRPEAALPEGTYTLTFRVTSADSHTVSGGFVFSVGEGGAPTRTVAELLEGQDESGTLTDVLFALARAIAYAALAAMLGALAFCVGVWRPASPPGEADRHFFAAGRRIAVVGGLLLAFAAAAGVVFQGASAAGIPALEALSTDVVGEVLDTRYGETALVRFAASLAFAVVALFAWRRGSSLSRPAAVLLALWGGVAAASFGWGGHAGVASPVAVTVGAAFAHVVAMAAWFGGIGILLGVVPRITKLLPAESRTALLADLVAHFSPLAIAAVAVLLISGIAQSLVHLSAIADLWQTGFGRAILAKALLLGGLTALGAYNRLRLRPRLCAAAAQGAAPGAAGRALRAALRAEVALAVAVLAVSSVLVSMSPASADQDIFSESASAGPIEVELVFEPTAVGVQEVHAYLFDGVSGRQWDEIEEIRLTATETEREIGPLPIELRRAGPGHYLSGGRLIAVPGTWRLELDIRATEFDAWSTSFEIRVR